MRVLVCGSRTFTNEQAVEWMLEGIYQMENSSTDRMMVIEGGARGADALAEAWAKGWGTEYAFPHLQFPADWETHGKRAGYLRNVQMLQQGKPDVVLAFVDKPLAESKGTAMMVKLAREAGVPTYVIEAM
jgi:hypothetical protein